MSIAQPITRTGKRHIPFQEMLKLIQAVSSVAEIGKISFNEKESNDRINRHDESTLATQVKIGNTTYEVIHHRNEQHEQGYGGNATYTTQLSRESRALLVSTFYHDWATTSDDFFDYDGKREASIELLEKEPLARKVFEAALGEGK